ncbi:MAG: DUF507 family protein [Pseudobdellovibrionaceae bacterium]|nr:DUF507 family protein [Bdellovibrionales bacterium]USN47312.1 MAG: DUF507 family protein [Pseudobdellovibrionaceae bacterium]
MISEDRQNYLAFIITDGLWKDDLVDYADDDVVIRTARQAVAKYNQELIEIDTKARQMVASLKRNVQEGSPEWDVMYKKYFEEEMQRRSG